MKSNRVRNNYDKIYFKKQKKKNLKKYVIGNNGQIMMKTIITILLLHLYFTILSVSVMNIHN